jgi:hypothetical protein
VSAISAQVPGQGWYHKSENINDGQQVPTILGSSGAPIIYGRSPNGNYSDDGVQGMITNKTDVPIVVSVGAAVPASTSGYAKSFSNNNPKAILLPNDWMPYQLNESGTITFYQYSGDASPDPPVDRFKKPRYMTLTLVDPWWIGFPDAYFEGRSGGAFGEGDTQTYYNRDGQSIWVRREHDGWYVRTSQEYVDLFGNPNQPETSDWAIFNINVLNIGDAFAERD